jgi:hypothetical protein
MPKVVDPFFDNYSHLKPFPDFVLRDIARNGSAQKDYRLKAFEILVNRESPYAKHEDFRGLAQELEIELEGIQFEFHPDPSPKPMTCGVTTETLFRNAEEVSNVPLEELTKPRFTGFDGVEIKDSDAP